MDRGTIRTRVRQFLKDEDNTGYHWSTDQLNNWIDDATIVAEEKTKILRTRLAASTVTDAAFFSAAASVIELDSNKVTYDGNFLVPITIEEAATYSAANWEDEVADRPWGVIYGPYGTRVVRIFPALPSNPASAGAVVFHNVPYTALMTNNDASELTLLSLLHQLAIVYGAVGLAYVQDFDMHHPDKAKTFFALRDQMIGVAPAPEGGQ